MRVIISTLLLCMCYSGFCQEFKEVVLSDDVTLSIPTPFDVVEKQGQSLTYSYKNHDDQIYISSWRQDILMFYYLENTSIAISSVEQLKQFYEDMFKTPEDSLIVTYRKSNFDWDYRNIGDIIIYHCESRLMYDDPGSDSYFEAYKIFLHNKMYTFSFQHPFSDNGKINSMREKFFASIEIREDLTIEDQFTK